MINFLFKKPHPKIRFVYAVTAGAYLGELLVYIETDSNSYKFLSLPSMINREIPIEKFKIGIEGKIVDIVKKLPRDIFNICKLQYQKNNVQKI